MSFFFPLQVFVSDNKNTSSRDVDNFFNFADMQMGLWMSINCLFSDLKSDFLKNPPSSLVWIRVAFEYLPVYVLKNEVGKKTVW